MGGGMGGGMQDSVLLFTQIDLSIVGRKLP